MNGYEKLNWGEVARGMRRHQLEGIHNGLGDLRIFTKPKRPDESVGRRIARSSWEAFHASKDPLFRREWSADSCIAAFEGLRRIVGKEGGDWIADSVLRVLLLTVGVRA